jgi:NADPH:quinone reductase-like Zn-dependent oxidoreductase
VALGAAHGGDESKVLYLKNVGEEVTKLVFEGQLQVPVTRVIPMEEVPAALQEMLAANTTGKIVLDMRND